MSQGDTRSDNGTEMSDPGAAPTRPGTPTEGVPATSTPPHSADAMAVFGTSEGAAAAAAALQGAPFAATHQIGARVWFTGLGQVRTWQQLKDLCRVHGDVVFAEIMEPTRSPPDTAVYAALATVTCTDDHTARGIINATHGYMHHGRLLVAVVAAEDPRVVHFPGLEPDATPNEVSGILSACGALGSEVKVDVLAAGPHTEPSLPGHPASMPSRVIVSCPATHPAAGFEQHIARIFRMTKRQLFHVDLAASNLHMKIQASGAGYIALVFPEDFTPMLFIQRPHISLAYAVHTDGWSGWWALKHRLATFLCPRATSLYFREDATGLVIHSESELGVLCRMMQGMIGSYHVAGGSPLALTNQLHMSFHLPAQANV